MVIRLLWFRYAEGKIFQNNGTVKLNFKFFPEQSF